ncbi:MAG: hypothetical protein QM778_25090 [Myxococcales bacterium]
MESVIGQYASEEEATQAVRALERDHQMSIQDLFIADRKRRIWRRFTPPQGRSFSENANFLVVMRGEAGDIEKARKFLD